MKKLIEFWRNLHVAFKWIALGGLIYFTLNVILNSINKKEENYLLHDNKLCVGTVIYVGVLNKKSGHYSIEYDFNIGKTSFSNFYQNLTEHETDELKSLLNQHFPVIYAPNDPSINRMLINRTDFEKFNIDPIFYDSLIAPYQYLFKE
jgi:hypothetical protein